MRSKYSRESRRNKLPVSFNGAQEWKESKLSWHPMSLPLSKANQEYHLVVYTIEIFLTKIWRRQWFKASQRHNRKENVICQMWHERSQICEDQTQEPNEEMWKVKKRQKKKKKITEVLEKLVHVIILEAEALAAAESFLASAWSALTTKVMVGLNSASYCTHRAATAANCGDQWKLFVSIRAYMRKISLECDNIH